jgi:hypothetical protein
LLQRQLLHLLLHLRWLLLVPSLLGLALTLLLLLLLLLVLVVAVP